MARETDFWPPRAHVHLCTCAPSHTSTFQTHTHVHAHTQTPDLQRSHRVWRIPNSTQCRHCCDLIPCCLDSAALDSPLHPCALQVTVIVLALKSDHVGPLPKPREGLPCQSTRLCGSRGPVIGLLFAHSACAPRPPSWHCAQSSPACTLSCYRCPDTHTLFLPLPQPLLDSAQMFPLSAFTPLGRPSIPLCLLFLAVRHHLTSGVTICSLSFHS